MELALPHSLDLSDNDIGDDDLSATTLDPPVLTSLPSLPDA
jgi:hypothetical protein